LIRRDAPLLSALASSARACCAKISTAVRMASSGADTEVSRGVRRHLRIALSIGALFLSRGVSFLVMLATVPLTVGYLGAERYGIWLTLSSLVSMVSFADLGIGNGLRTLISEADGKRDQLLLAKLVSSAACVLTGTAVLLLLGLVVGYRGVAWTSVFGSLTSDVRNEVPLCVLVLGATFLLAMPLQIAQSVQHGLQKGYSATLWTTGGSVLSLGGLLTAVAFKTTLVPLAAALAGAPLVASLLNYVWFFWRERPDLRPRWRAVDLGIGLRLLRTGGLFMLLQISVAFSFTSDNLVVGAVLGVASVPLLAVPAKLFGFVQQFMGTLTGPLWPAFGEAAARGDAEWVRRTLRRAYSVSLVTALVSSLVLVVGGRWIIGHWSRHQVDVSVTLLIPLAVWTVVAAWGSTVSTFLNGVGQVAVQTIAAVVMAPVAFGLKWLLVGPLGLPGVVWATVFAYAICAVGPVWWAERRVLRDIENRTRVPGGVASERRVRV
jgi:O-antigen/teichoic acid export membrane protein